MASEEPVSLAATPVGAMVGKWKEDTQLVLQSAGGCICKIGKKSELNRQEVCQNVAILKPVVEHLGSLASKSTIFFFWSEYCCISRSEHFMNEPACYRCTYR